MNQASKGEKCAQQVSLQRLASFMPYSRSSAWNQMPSAASQHFAISEVSSRSLCSGIPERGEGIPPMLSMPAKAHRRSTHVVMMEGDALSRSAYALSVPIWCSVSLNHMA